MHQMSVNTSRHSVGASNQHLLPASIKPQLKAVIDTASRALHQGPDLSLLSSLRGALRLPRDLSPVLPAAPGSVDAGLSINGLPGSGPLAPNDCFSLHGRSYQVIKSLQSGASGQVFLARDIEAERLVALKVVALGGPRDPARFEKCRALQREVENHRRCSEHPNIVSLYDWHIEEPAHGEESSPAYGYLVLEAALHGDLCSFTLERCRSGKALSAAEALSVVAQIAMALNYCLEQQILHRDIKSENIVLAGSNPHELKVKLIDFGASKDISEGQRRPVSPVGTPGYCAPEVLRNQFELPIKRQEYGANCDVFSLGCLLHVLLVGTFAFDGMYGDGRVLLRNILRHRRCDTSKEPAELRPLIDAMLAPNPAKRLTMQQVCEHPLIRAALASST